MLVGLPGAGKSTWRESQSDFLSGTGFDVVVISSDDFVEAQAFENECTYDEAFKRIDHSRLMRALHDRCRTAGQRSGIVIIDRTNLTAKARQEFLSDLPPHYKRVAVIFRPSDATRAARMAGRIGKTIPVDIQARMAATFTLPTLAEGFDAIAPADDYCIGKAA